MSSDNQTLYGRLVKLTISTPASPGGAAAGALTGALGAGKKVDYHSTTRDELELSGGEKNNDGGRDPGLRITFKITKTHGKEPNTSEIQVYNMNPDNRAKIQQKGVKVTLEAGYEGSGLSRIFRGDLRIGDNKREGADWISTLKIGDGERAFIHARVQESFAPGSTGGDVIKYLGDASGLQLGNIPDAVLDLTVRYDQGYMVSGKWSDEMARFCKSVGYVFSIQDQTLQVLLPERSKKKSGKRVDNFVAGEIPEISSETGLIGSPEFGTPEKKGHPAMIKFTALLRPAVINGKVYLNSEAHKGNVIVKKAVFDADTHGNNWFTHYEGLLEKNT